MPCGPRAGRPAVVNMVSIRDVRSASSVAPSAAVCLPAATSASTCAFASATSAVFTVARSMFFAFATSATDFPASSSVFNSVSVIPKTFDTAVSGDGRSPLISDDDTVGSAFGAAGVPAAEFAGSVVSVACATATTLLRCATCALAKPVMPSTDAPVATTSPEATAIFVKRDLIFIVLCSFLWLYSRVVLA